MEPFINMYKQQKRMYEQGMETLSDMGLLPDYADTMVNVEVGPTDSEQVWQEHHMQLEHYTDDSEEDTPLLIVPSMVNEDYILDLQEGRSVVETLQDEGHDVYMLDWGEPDRTEKSRRLDDYVSRYLDDAVDAVREDADSDEVNLLGYCMGGTMAAMYTSFNQDKVNALGLMASAFEMDGSGGEIEEAGQHIDPELLVEEYGNMPGELLDIGFTLQDPVENTVTKYIDLWENRDDEERVEFFAAMEKWLNDSKDVPGEAYRKFVEDIYQDNKLVEGRMQLEQDGRHREPVDLGAIDVPLIQVLGEYDDIVPPESSRALNDLAATDDTETIEASSGHVGLSVSGRAHEDVWPEVADWYSERS
ncbi:MAG: alpha/beta fold hydrolase [Candidatus Nanohaloarchaea archaeon]|nr:alpha/beta fold hydrolase [Candidatus Nanohaloarchaea archaeon]